MCSADAGTRIPWLSDRLQVGTIFQTARNVCQFVFKSSFLGASLLSHNSLMSEVVLKAPGPGRSPPLADGSKCSLGNVSEPAPCWSDRYECSLADLCTTFPTPSVDVLPAGSFLAVSSLVPSVTFPTDHFVYCCLYPGAGSTLCPFRQSCKPLGRISVALHEV